MIHFGRRHVAACLLIASALVLGSAVPGAWSDAGLRPPSVDAAKPDKTPPAKGKPVPTPVPTPKPKPTPAPTPRPTPKPTPKATAKATPAPTPRATTKAPPPVATPTAHAPAVPAATAAGTGSQAPARPAASASPSTAAAVGGSGGETPGTPVPSVDTEPAGLTAPNGTLAAALLGVAIALGIGGLFLAFGRRRRSPSVAVTGQPDSFAGRSRLNPEMGIIEDPLLAAMARTATERTGRSPAQSDSAPRMPVWVRRLDADINGLSDEASRGGRPPSHDDGPPLH